MEMRSERVLRKKMLFAATKLIFFMAMAYISIELYELIPGYQSLLKPNTRTSVLKEVVAKTQIKGGRHGNAYYITLRDNSKIFSIEEGDVLEELSLDNRKDYLRIEKGKSYYLDFLANGWFYKVNFELTQK